MLARFGNRLDDRGALNGFQVLEFLLEGGVPCARHWDLFHSARVRNTKARPEANSERVFELQLPDPIRM